MVDSVEKGTRAENVIKDTLKKLTKLDWTRTPGSGALDPKHLLKGDLYVPGKENVYCIECKHYKEDQFTSKIFTSKSPMIFQWWEQAERQGKQVNRKPLLIFKYDRSKLFVAFADMPFNLQLKYVSVFDMFYISLLEDWIIHEEPKFIL